MSLGIADQERRRGKREEIIMIWKAGGGIA